MPSSDNPPATRAYNGMSFRDIQPGHSLGDKSYAQIYAFMNRGNVADVYLGGMVSNPGAGYERLHQKLQHFFEPFHNFNLLQDKLAVYKGDYNRFREEIQKAEEERKVFALLISEEILRHSPQERVGLERELESPERRESWYSQIRPIQNRYCHSEHFGTLKDSSMDCSIIPVAVKYLSKMNFERPEYEKYCRLFRQEMDVLLGLNHENVVRAYQGYEDEHGWYLTTNFINGLSLNYLYQSTEGILEVLEPKQKYLGLQAILSLASGLANALAHSHQEGIIHRDVTPNNIMIDFSGRVYLTDFGCALKIPSEKMKEGVPTKECIGTVFFMSPQQMTGLAHPSGDIHMLMSSVYYFLTRHHYFGETDDFSLQNLINKKRSRFKKSPRHYNSSLPKDNDLESLVMGCLRTEFKDYPVKSALELRDRMARMLQRYHIEDPTEPLREFMETVKVPSHLVSDDYGSTQISQVR